MRLRDAVARIARGLGPAALGEDLTATQSGVLATIVRDGPMRAGHLAEAKAVNPTMLSRVLGHLEGRGLVERASDPEDGRRTRVRATARGRRLVARLQARRAELLLARLGELPGDQVAALAAALPALEALARGGGR